MDIAEPLPPPGPRRKLLPKPFNILWNNGVLTLVAASDLSERSWAAWFGEIQAGLEKRKWKGQDIQTCTIDLRPCRWADPLPLLSLALSLAEYERKDGHQVRVHLPGECEKQTNAGRTHANPDCLERGRLLKFMAREGFLDLLAGRQLLTALDGTPRPPLGSREAWLGDKTFQVEDISRLRELQAPLAFEESTCVPAVLLALDKESSAPLQATLDGIDDWVAGNIQTRINQVVTDKVPAWAHRGLLYRIQILLRETLHNIAEHAYRDHGGLAAVYVRYREGRLGQTRTAWDAMEPHIKREDDHRYVALMGAIPSYQAFSRTRAGFFEVFVLDGGCGLVERLLQNQAYQFIRKSPNPLHQAMLAVFKGASTKAERPTEKGGLYLLRCYLEPWRDYVRVRDGDSWWGWELPLPISQSQSTPAGQFTRDCEARGHARTDIRGLAWTLRLSWLDRMDTGLLPDGCNWREMTKEERRPLLAVLRGEEPGDMPGMCVEDWRLDDPHRQGPVPDVGAEILLLLPSRDWMKNTVQDHLRESLTYGRLRPAGTLVVGDIRSEEALTYVAAIRRARRLPSNIPYPPARIILVTRDLRTVALSFQGDLYQEDRAATNEFVSGKGPWTLPKYFHALRSHDGQRLWKAIGDGDDGPLTAFRREWVDWHDGCLDGFLDFPATLTNPVCRAIYSLSLERLVALFPQKDCRLIALDNLVESLVIRFRAQQRPRAHARVGDDPTDSIDVYVGSVRVTGLTQQDRTPRTERPTVFHFLGHPSGDSFRNSGGGGGGHYLLPWLGPLRGAPPEECTSKDKPRDWYRRIGRTAGIARAGWKAFRLPRFDADGNSLYEATPYETYRAWQDPSRTPMKLGHWSYGGHHDLLTVNMLLAFDTELDQISLVLGGRLARFVYDNLFRALGLGREDLNDEGQRLWDTIEDDGFRRLLPRSPGNQRGIVVFPAHPVTDHVVGRLTGWLDDSRVLRSTLERCVPILPLRRHRGGSGLQLSGLTLERLQSFVPVDGTPPPLVTFFDDALISGHTFRQMKSLLHGLGFHEIYSLTMLDRQRLPSAHHIDRAIGEPKEAKPRYRHVSYWRLDAPAMGSPAHCPLCKGLGRVKDLAGGIESPERRQRALRWLGIWRERNPASDWGDAGLRPIPLELSKPNRKFGIVPDHQNPPNWKQAGKEGKEIVLTNSAGLVAWAAELYSVTSRDDLALRLLEKEKLDPEVRVQLFASQLLLFHGEFDTELAVNLGFQLALALFQSPTHDRNTALGAITLLACGDEFLTKVLKRLKAEPILNNNAVVSDKDTNLDFLTLLELSSVRKIRGAPKPSPALFSASSRRETYRLLQENICSGEPDHHSSPFRRFQAVSSPPMPSDRGTLESVVEAAAKLRRRLEELSPDWLRYRGEPTPLIEDFADFRKTLEAQLTDLTKPIKDALSPSRTDTPPNVDLTSCKALAREVLANGHRIALALFTPVGVASLREEKSVRTFDAPPADSACINDGLGAQGAAQTKAGEESERRESERLERPLIMDELQKAVSIARKYDRTIAIMELTLSDRRNAAGALDLAGKEEYYLIWDSLVGNALDSILSNVRHADPEPIICPWSVHPPQEQTADPASRPPTAHLWIRVDIQEKYVAILLRNRTGVGAEEVATKTRDKPWIKTFAELGGSVTWSNPEADVLEARVQIPYSFFLDNSSPTGADHDAIQGACGG